MMCNRIGDVPLDHLPAADIIRFLHRPEISNVTQLGQYSMVNRFLQFWAHRGDMPALTIPPPPRFERTYVPHIYSRFQIRLMLTQCRITQAKSRSIDAPTFRLFLLTLYATGARVGEVRNLRISDLDLRHGKMLFRSGSPERTRCIPINADLNHQLRRFLTRNRSRESLVPCVFSTVSGRPLVRSYLNQCFRRLQRAGAVVRSDDSSHEPRMQDLRPTFAVHRLTSWIKQGVDMNRMLPALSAYMGYSGLVAAEKFLALTPERFRRQLRILSPENGRKHWRNDSELMTFLAKL